MLDVSVEGGEWGRGRGWEGEEEEVAYFGSCRQ